MWNSILRVNRLWSYGWGLALLAWAPGLAFADEPVIELIPESQQVILVREASSQDLVGVAKVDSSGKVTSSDQTSSAFSFASIITFILENNGGLFFSNDQYFSVSLAKCFRVSGDPAHDAQYVFAEVEPGVAGGKASVGYRTTSVIRDISMWDSEVKVSYYRAWFSNLGANAQESTGLEMKIGISLIQLTGGLFVHLGSQGIEFDHFRLGMGFQLPMVKE